MSPEVVVLEHGADPSTSVPQAVHALQRVGARVRLTADYDAGLACDGLVLSGDAAFAAVAAGVRGVRGDWLVERRLAGGRPVLGIGAGLLLMFEHAVEPGRPDVPGLGQWPGVVEPLPEPQPGWNAVAAPPDTRLLKGVEDERFRFLLPCGVQRWAMPEPVGGAHLFEAPAVTWSRLAEGAAGWLAAVENGPLSATAFHPERSGEAGVAVLENWVRGL